MKRQTLEGVEMKPQTVEVQNQDGELEAFNFMGELVNSGSEYDLYNLEGFGEALLYSAGEARVYRLDLDNPIPGLEPYE